MADIVNLRQVRKAKARAEKERIAAENRAAFGRPKAGRELERLGSERTKRFIDGHRREAAAEPDDD